MGAPQVKNKPQKPVPPKPPKPVVKVAGKEALTIRRVPKDFRIVDWDRAGKKVMAYAGSGMGKTTLAMLLNKPVFVGTDDGGGIMRHPVTGERIKAVEGVEDYQDVCDVLQTDVFEPYDEIVVDTITEVQRWMVPWMLKNIKKQGGGYAVNLEDYGFHKGYRHWFETMELLLNSFNRWVHKGKTIVLLAQSTGHRMTNESGEDYKIAGPDLYHDDKHSILNLVKSWCDHVFRINYTNISVDKKKVSTNDERAVYIHPRIEFIAKSRTIPQDYPCVEFKDKTDDSIWRLLNEY
jgi:hypothetical protein